MIKHIKALFRRKPSAPAPATPVCKMCEIRANLMHDMHAKERCTANAFSALSRRVSALQKEYPEMWALYFTKAGDERRKAAQQ